MDSSLSVTSVVLRIFSDYGWRPKTHCIVRPWKCWQWCMTSSNVKPCSSYNYSVGSIYHYSLDENVLFVWKLYNKVNSVCVIHSTAFPNPGSDFFLLGPLTLDPSNFICKILSNTWSTSNQVCQQDVFNLYIKFPHTAPSKN